MKKDEAVRYFLCILFIFQFFYKIQEYFAEKVSVDTYYFVVCGRESLESFDRAYMQCANCFWVIEGVSRALLYALGVCLLTFPGQRITGYEPTDASHLPLCGICIHVYVRFSYNS